MLNAAGIIGRITPGFFARSIGVPNMVSVACYGCSAVIFAMIGLKSVASVVIIAILYGLLTGVCEYQFSRLLKSSDYFGRLI